MRMDFTLDTYERLLEGFRQGGYTFLRFRDLAGAGTVSYGGPAGVTLPPKCAVMRHDVDRLPGNALRMAELEAAAGIGATYYFRMVNGVFDPVIIGKIAGLGHEIGYHYEDLSLASGDRRRARELFGEHLERLREVAEVRTLCMHGSPYSNWDNRDLWKSADYREYDLLLEPYFDIDYHEFFYVTDTGRRWNHPSANLRDVVDSGFDIPIRSSEDLLQKIRTGQLPDKVILNTHPQRWFDPGLPWFRELILQKIKNRVKSVVNRFR